METTNTPAAKAQTSAVTATKPDAILKSMETQFAKVLPKIITPERFVRVALSACSRNPTLGQAMADPRNRASVLSAFMRCAELGLEPDGRRATINCYRKGQTGMYDVTFIPMYQGLAELVMRSGLVSTIHAEKVCQNDEFEWDLGRIVKHVPKWGDRGEPILFYCHVVFKDGMVKDEIMEKDEVDAIMKRSSAYQGASKYGKSCPWMTDYAEMAKKTVFRRCSKWLPLSPEQRAAIEADDDDYKETAKAVANDAEMAFMGAVPEAEPEVEVTAAETEEQEKFELKQEEK